MKVNKFRLFQRRYFLRYRILILLIIIVLITSLVFRQLSFKGVLNIQTYKYAGVVEYINSADLENLIEANIHNKNYFTYNQLELEDVIKKTFLAAKSVKVYKKFPFTVEIHLQERVPIAIVNDTEKINYLIDEDGYVLGNVAEKKFDLPLVTYEKKLFVGQFIDTNIIPIALEILNNAKVENIEVSSISFKPEYSRFYTGPIQVFMNNDNSIKESMIILSRLMTQSASDDKKLSKVDLRYEKVIVSYE